MTPAEPRETSDHVVGAPHQLDHHWRVGCGPRSVERVRAMLREPDTW